LVDRRIHAASGERAFFDGGHGRRRQTIPVAWTDLAAEDPFVVVSAGRAYFRVSDLLRLSDLLESLTSPVPEGAASRQGGVK